MLTTGHMIDTGQIRIDETAIAEFAARLRGHVIRPGDSTYDAARQAWNGLIDRRPALIVRPTGTADVVEAVNFAQEHTLLLSIRGGGHNVAGNAVNDGGLMIDLSSMRLRRRLRPLGPIESQIRPR